MATKKAKENTVVIGSLYRFGYDLTVAAHSKDEAHDALMAEYERVYPDWNDYESMDALMEDEEEYNEYLRLRAGAEECIEYWEPILGKVEWR